MSADRFPEWVNTLVNGTIAGALIFGVVEVAALNERISVLETRALGVLKQLELRQQTTDIVQTGRIDQLEKRVDKFELRISPTSAPQKSAPRVHPPF